MSLGGSEDLPAGGMGGVGDLLIAFVDVDALYLYFDRYRTEYLRNLMFGRLFSEAFCFARQINLSASRRLTYSVAIHVSLL
jgi:hypothetical protein